MSLIEGVGDEVTLLICILFIIVTAAIAWMSTRVDATPYTSIVIIDRDRFVELLRRLRGAPARTNNDSAASVAARTDTNETAIVTPEPTEARNGSLGSELNEQSNSTVGHSSGTAAEAPVSQPDTADSDVASADSINPPGDVLQQQQEAAGTGATGNLVEIRLQYIDGRQRTVLASPDDTIGHFKRSHFATELADNSIVRFIASGKELRDDASTLRSLQLGRTGAVIHCLVTPQRTVPPPPDGPNAVAGHQFDVGVLVFPLFGTVLAALWYARVMYRGYFNGTSTFSLFAVSFLYVIALLASLRGGTGHQAPQHAHID